MAWADGLDWTMSLSFIMPSGRVFSDQLHQGSGCAIAHYADMINNTFHDAFHLPFPPSPSPPHLLSALDPRETQLDHERLVKHAQQHSPFLLVLFFPPDDSLLHAGTP